MSPLFFSSRLLAAQSDARLVQLARDGHERAFEALVKRHRRSLQAYASRLLGSGPRAEDALQQALLAAWLAIGRGDEVRDAGAWLHRIVHNMALNLTRGADREVFGLDPEHHSAESPDVALERRINLHETLAGVARLPPQQRYALLETAVHGRSRNDVAVELGLSSGAVRGLAYRARTTLRAGLTAITPQPLLAWAAGGGPTGAPLAELSAGAVPAGIAAALMKGGAAALTAGALVAGVTVAGHGSSHHRHRAPVPGVSVPTPGPVVSVAAARGAATAAATTGAGGTQARSGRHGSSAQSGHNRGEHRGGRSGRDSRGGRDDSRRASDGSGTSGGDSRRSGSETSGSSGSSGSGTSDGGHDGSGSSSATLSTSGSDGGSTTTTSTSGSSGTSDGGSSASSDGGTSASSDGGTTTTAAGSTSDH